MCLLIILSMSLLFCLRSSYNIHINPSHKSSKFTILIASLATREIPQYTLINEEHILLIEEAARPFYNKNMKSAAIQGWVMTLF